MIRTRWRATAAGATLFIVGQFVLAAPVGAAPATATVTADMPSAAPAGRLWTFNDFFPRTVTVRTGTDLQFINQGFHTFTVLPTGTTPVPDWRTNGVAKDDTDDTTLNPNGTTKSEFNVPALSPTSSTCGSPALPCDFDGSSTVSSGAPFGPPSGPFVVHVSAAPGVYLFICRVHAGMSGKLKVVAPTRPSQMLLRSVRPWRGRSSTIWRVPGSPTGRRTGRDHPEQGRVEDAPRHRRHLEPRRKGRAARILPARSRCQARRQGRVHTEVAQRAAHGDLPGRSRNGHDRLLRGRLDRRAVRATGLQLQRRAAGRDRIWWRQRRLRWSPRRWTDRVHLGFGDHRASSVGPTDRRSRRTSSIHGPSHWPVPPRAPTPTCARSTTAWRQRSPSTDLDNDEYAKTDRIACPWVIRTFIDHDAAIVCRRSAPRRP